MQKAIDKVWQFLEKEEKPLCSWSLIIARELSEYHHSLAVEWAAECIRIRLSESESWRITKLDKYIQQALNTQNISTLECNQIARKIWDLQPERDRIQTAVDRLWWAIGFFNGENENEPRGNREIESAVWLVSVEDEFVSLDIINCRSLLNYRLLEQYLEVALSIHEKYKSKKQSKQ